MDESQKSVFVDDEVASQVLAIVREAKEYVVLVSPYIHLWGHALEALGLAVQRGIDVTVVARLGEDRLENEAAWLKNNGIKVVAAKNLHAKIYLNERAVVVSSMNLLESSMKNSLEIGLVVRDEHAQQQIRDYVNNTLMHLAIAVRHAVSPVTQQPTYRPAQPDLRVVTGVCIRCSQPIAFDPARPLCKDCYESWAQWGNPEYPEVFCHACGRRSDVTYERPLCRDCFRRQR